MDMPLFFTVDEAASILRVSRVTVHRKLSGGEILIHISYREPDTEADVVQSH